MSQINKISKQGNCPICGFLNVKEIYPEETDIKKVSFTYKFTTESRKTFRVLKCNECTHVFCSPIPKNFYKNYEDVVDIEYLKHSNSRILSAKKVLEEINKYKESGILLDVGCATGDFLIEAKKCGFNVEGLELSDWSSKIAQKKGIRIHKKTLRSLSEKFSNRYDVITLWGVIEHFENPKKELTYISKLLKPGGLLVLWTGDVNGIVSKVLKRRWWYWQGQHIQYFSYLSLNTLANSSGLKHLVMFKYPMAVTIDQLGNSLNRYKFKKIIIIFLKPFFVLKRVWYLRIPGEMFWIGTKYK